MSTLPVFALILFLLPTRSDLAASMLEVRRPALIERMNALLEIRSYLEDLGPPTADNSGSFGTPAGVTVHNLVVMLPGVLPLTDLKALRTATENPTDHELWLLEVACRELQSYAYMPDDLLNSREVKAEFCAAAQLAAVDPDDFEYIDADGATEAINALLGFEYLAIFRPISENLPRAAATPPLPGYLSAEVLLFEMNNTDPAARFVFETTNDEAALATADQSALFDNLGVTGREVIYRHVGIFAPDAEAPFEKSRLDEARALSAGNTDVERN